MCIYVLQKYMGKGEEGLKPEQEAMTLATAIFLLSYTQWKQ